VTFATSSPVRPLSSYSTSIPDSAYRVRQPITVVLIEPTSYATSYQVMAPNTE
jgi:hypothetical protein